MTYDERIAWQAGELLGEYERLVRESEGMDALVRAGVEVDARRYGNNRLARDRVAARIQDVLYDAMACDSGLRKEIDFWLDCGVHALVLSDNTIAAESKRTT